MSNLYPSIKPLPKIGSPKPKAYVPKGQITKEDYEAKSFKSQFKKGKTR